MHQIENKSIFETSGSQGFHSQEVSQNEEIVKSILLLDCAKALSTIERRAVIDVGSGSTKFCIADVDTETNEIVNILFEDSFPVPYQASLEKNQDVFDAFVKARGIEVFQKIHDLCASYHVDKISGVATEAFRRAHNGQAFSTEIAEKTGIHIRVIPQTEEGKLAFYAALANEKDLDPDELFVWDIGTGSFQLTIESEGDLLSYMGNVGSVPFKKAIIEKIQKRESDTVNPMTEEEYKLADAYARFLARKAAKRIKNKVKELDGQVLGIGRLFYNSIQPMGRYEGKITRKDLRKFIENALNKTDEEMHDPYAHINLSNAILVLGFMKALHIHEIRPLDTKTTNGMLIYESYWNNRAVERMNVA